MTAFMDTVSLVRAEARQVDIGRILLAVLLAVPFAVGWSARYAVRGLGFAVSFVVAAAQVGWRSAAPRPRDG